MNNVSIIFVNYFTSDLIRESIKTIKDNTFGLSYDIIIVDNSNDLQEFDKVNSIDSSVKVIDAKANLGFGNANNLAAANSNSDVLFFLNGDTLLVNNAICEMYQYLINHNDVGIVGANLYTKNMQPNHSFLKQEKNIRNEKKFNSYFKLLKRKLFKKKDDYNYSNKPIEIFGYVSGASLMIKRDVFEQIGGFDKDIFMYAEEVLLCYKVRKNNYRIFNIPSARIIHFEGGSFSNSSMKRLTMFVNGNYIYYSKAFGKKIALKYLLMMRKIYSRKAFISKFFSRNYMKYYKSFSEAYYNKIKEVVNDDI